MNKEEFDEWFDRAFDESVKGHSFVPDSEASWERMQQLVKKRNRRRRQLRTLPYIVASFMLGALIFGTPAATTAFKPIYEAYVTVKDGVTRIVFGSMQKTDTVPLTPPPPGHEEDNRTYSPPTANTGGEQISQLQTKSYEPTEQPEVSFPVPSLPFIPDGFTLTEVLTHQYFINEKPSDLHYTYTNNDGYILSINFTKMRPNQIISTGSADEGVTIKRITIQSREAFLSIAEDGWSGLEFVYGDIFVRINGPITDTDIKRIAEEMKISN